MMSESNSVQNRNQMPPSMAMLQMISGTWVAQAIYVAAKLGIADLLKDSPKSSQKLAEATGVDARSLYRVLRALASIGVFAEGEDNCFHLTPLSACLQTGVPDSVRHIAIMYGEAFNWQPWGNIFHSVKTGKTAFGHVFGMEFFEYLTQNPEAGKIFDGAMTDFTTTLTANITADYDFSSFRKIVDVAGGQGGLISSILKAHPTMQGVLFDLPQTIENAKAFIEAQGVTSRCELVGGNFFESVPSGGDAYIMKSIIHDWDDEKAIAILKNCHKAMVENGKLLLVEMVIGPGNQTSLGKFIDLAMLVMACGCERTEAEYRALFEASGFRLTNIFNTQSTMNVIEGVRV